ncbi:hypothetical protein B6A42_13070 [Vibrio coralliilyticus]|nr:hypothetical protein B6A42_13070 [Vibrio coralliilyticus]
MFSLILANSHPFAIPFLFKVKKRVAPTMSAVTVHCNASIHNWEMVGEYGCQYQIMQNATLGDTNTYMYVYGATADADF